MEKLMISDYNGTAHASVRSFRTFDDAHNFKVKLYIMGIDAIVQEFPAHEGNTFYVGVKVIRTSQGL